MRSQIAIELSLEVSFGEAVNSRIALGDRDAAALRAVLDFTASPKSRSAKRSMATSVHTPLNIPTGGDRRFRTTTVHRALDVLEDQNSGQRLISLIEELGLGDELDRVPEKERYKAKLRNLIAKHCRLESTSIDAEGIPVADRIVREAATKVPPKRDQRPSEDSPQPLAPPFAAFINSLAVDGWKVESRTLLPITPVPIEAVRSSMRSHLHQLGADEAVKRLDQLEKGLDEGHWESANGDTRSFLNSAFEAVARQTLRTPSALSEGEARAALQKNGFFKADRRDASTSLEPNLVKALTAYLGTEGAHSGTSDHETAIYRYAITLLTADHFLQRAIRGVR